MRLSTSKRLILRRSLHLRTFTGSVNWAKRRRSVCWKVTQTDSFGLHGCLPPLPWRCCDNRAATTSLLGILLLSLVLVLFGPIVLLSLLLILWWQKWCEEHSPKKLWTWRTTSSLNIYAISFWIQYLLWAYNLGLYQSLSKCLKRKTAPFCLELRNMRPMKELKALSFDEGLPTSATLKYKYKYKSLYYCNYWCCVNNATCI